MTDINKSQVEWYAIHLDCDYGPGSHRYGPFETEAAAQRFIDESALVGWGVREVVR